MSKNCDFVSFEAAKSLCELSEHLKVDIDSAFNTLITYLSNGTPVQKYASLKVMNRLASKKPQMVAICSSDIEPLINDSNPSVASMAISTLLKTCT